MGCTPAEPQLEAFTSPENTVPGLSWQGIHPPPPTLVAECHCLGDGRRECKDPIDGQASFPTEKAVVVKSTDMIAREED